MNYGITVITGGGTGIGKAIAKRLISRSQPVLICGRRIEPLLETKNSCSKPELLRTVLADISTTQGREDVRNALHKDEQVSALIHNAAVLEPVSKLINVDLDSWREHMAINVEGPLFLTKILVDRLKPSSSSRVGGRVLHLSSGAAHHPYNGWGPYCTSKAALHMVYRILANELAPLGIPVGSIRPGIVDTPMQDMIRQFDENVMPDVSRFKVMKDQGALYDPDEVGLFIDWLLNETDDVEFSEKEWDIRDDQCRQRWQSYV
jgi:NAD(P)-dependent dehydrogenase (short-subunit alcohol dehydrogenase family)